VWQQNRQQKVFYRPGGFTFVQSVWHSEIWTNITVYRASYSNSGGLELCFGRAKPIKDSPWLWDFVAKLQFAFECNYLGKILRLHDMSNLQDMSNFLFMSMTGPKMSQHIQVASILLHDAILVLGLFCLHLNTIGWSGHVQECSAKKRIVGTPFPHQIKTKATPNSSNNVSICLQGLIHWIFLFHCRLLTSGANLHVASTSVRSQPCFNVIVCISHLHVSLVVQKVMGTLSHTKKMYGNVVPTPLHPGHVTCTICRDNWLGFKSLWLGFRIRAYNQGVGSIFKLRGSLFRVRI